MRNRELKGAGLDKWRYLELRAFCRQYERKRHEAAQLLGLASRGMDGLPGGGSAGDPVYAAVRRRERLLADVEAIDQAAREADPVGYQAIWKNVTQGIRYEESGYYGCRSEFFRARRRFFAALDQILALRGQPSIVS